MVAHAVDYRELDRDTLSPAEFGPPPCVHAHECAEPSQVARWLAEHEPVIPDLPPCAALHAAGRICIQPAMLPRLTAPAE